MHGAIDTTNPRRYYLTDHLGSTRAVVDRTGEVKDSFDYYPFGLLMPGRTSDATGTLERFTGKERDTEAGLNLDYFGVRYYDPAVARWLSVDPLADEYPAWSPYNYVLNNPLALVDPDGRCPEGYKEGDIWNGSRCGPEVVVTATRLPAETQANVSIPLSGLGFGRSIAVGSRLGAYGAAVASLVYLNYLTNQALAQQGTFIPSTHTGTIVLPNTGDRPWWETIMNAERSLDDPESLEGATKEEVEELIPDSWVESPARTGKGTRYANPAAKGEQVRVMDGNPRDPNPKKRGPYVRVSKNGKVSDPVPLKGNPTIK